MKAAEQFAKLLRENGLAVDHKFFVEGQNKREYIRLCLRGKNYPGLAFYIVFDDEGSGSAQIFCDEVCKFTEQKNLTMLQTVNALNTKYRWVTFFVKDGKVNADINMAFTDETSDQIMMTTLRHYSDIIDDAYPIFMRAINA